MTHNSVTGNAPDKTAKEEYNAHSVFRIFKIFDQGTPFSLWNPRVQSFFFSRKGISNWISKRIKVRKRTGSKRMLTSSGQLSTRQWIICFHRRWGIYSLVHTTVNYPNMPRLEGFRKTDCADGNITDQVLWNRLVSRRCVSQTPLAQTWFVSTTTRNPAPVKLTFYITEPPLLL